MDNITFEDFKKLDMRIGTIISCEKVEDADKLLKLEVDFGPSTSHSTLRDESSGSDSKSSGSGESEKRQIISGIAQFYTPDQLVGKQCPFIVNLEPRVIRGLESQGMIMAADMEGSAVLLHPDKEIPRGSIVK